MRTGGFEVLEHPSDLGIEAWGETLAKAFVHAALGLSSIICDPSTVECTAARPVTIHADDIEQLLVRWLSEVLYQYDGQRFVSGAFDVYRLTERELQATIHGELLDIAKHRMRLDVKAVTYHQLSVRTDEKGWRVVVYFDI